MSNYSESNVGQIHVVSKFGPIRIELLDYRLRRVALGFGDMRREVRAGLYTLQCSAGPVFREELVKVEPGSVVRREFEIPFPATAPISVGETSYEFHVLPAVQYSKSQDKQRRYGRGGGLMIFARAIDQGGRAPIPMERLSLWDAEMRLVADFAADADRNDDEGWACFSAQVPSGGYVLRWRMAEGTDGLNSVDQSLWVSEGWQTLLFLAYNASQHRWERQGASIHMARLWTGFKPGPPREKISANQIPERELDEARINQTIEMILCGLRAGDLILPDDLSHLLLESQSVNPMLGILGAQNLLKTQEKNWATFDALIENLLQLIPDHPDVRALERIGQMMRDERADSEKAPLSWPPLLNLGYQGLIACDWRQHGAISENTLAEEAAVRLLPELPWSFWLSAESLPKHPFRDDDDSQRAFEQVIRLLRATPKGLSKAKSWQVLSELPGPAAERAWASSEMQQILNDPVVQRILRHLIFLSELNIDINLSPLPSAEFMRLGLPVATIKRGLRRMEQTLDLLRQALLKDHADAEMAAPPASHASKRIFTALYDLVPDLEGFFQKWIDLAIQNADQLNPMPAAEFSTPRSWEKFDFGEYQVHLEHRNPIGRLVVSVSRDQDGPGDSRVIIVLVGSGGRRLQVPVTLRSRHGKVLSGSAIVDLPTKEVVSELGAVIIPVLIQSNPHSQS